MEEVLWLQVPCVVLDQAVAQTFKLLVDSNALPAVPMANVGLDDISMAIYCEEAQQRALVVRCSRTLAVSLTSNMLETAAEDLTSTDVSDAVGEIANVIAGSLRGLLEKPGPMSTPFAMAAADLNAMRFYDQRSYLLEQDQLTIYRI